MRDQACRFLRLWDGCRRRDGLRGRRRLWVRLQEARAHLRRQPRGDAPVGSLPGLLPVLRQARCQACRLRLHRPCLRRGRPTPTAAPFCVRTHLPPGGLLLSSGCTTPAPHSSYAPRRLIPAVQRCTAAPLSRAPQLHSAAPPSRAPQLRPSRFHITCILVSSCLLKGSSTCHIARGVSRPCMG